jgi:hypothetical protein
LDPEGRFEIEEMEKRKQETKRKPVLVEEKRND